MPISNRIYPVNWQRFITFYIKLNFHDTRISESNASLMSRLLLYLLCVHCNFILGYVAGWFTFFIMLLLPLTIFPMVQFVEKKRMFQYVQFNGIAGYELLRKQHFNANCSYNLFLLQ